MYTPKSGINAGRKNNKAVKEYLEKHPHATGKEIARALKLSTVTVYKHLQEMNSCIDKED